MEDLGGEKIIVAMLPTDQSGLPAVACVDDGRRWDLAGRRLVALFIVLE
jgi:hypothetical protein